MTQALQTFGPPGDQWIYDPSTSSYDLTRREGGTLVEGHKVETQKGVIEVDVKKSALVIIDMQNFFLHPSLRAHVPGLAALHHLLTSAIPTARLAGIKILWVNWGLTLEEIEEMPPTHAASFGGIQREGDAKVRREGFGSELGNLGKGIEGGKLLVRDSWNADLYGELAACWKEGKKNGTDEWIHKNRMSAMWGPESLMQDYLVENGIKTLFFSGVNSDQCVLGTLLDAHNKGYDCCYLKDCCGTTSPPGCKEATEYNAAIVGFVSDSVKFAAGLA